MPRLSVCLSLCPGVYVFVCLCVRLCVSMRVYPCVCLCCCLHDWLSAFVVLLSVLYRLVSIDSVWPCLHRSRWPFRWVGQRISASSHSITPSIYIRSNGSKSSKRTGSLLPLLYLFIPPCLSLSSLSCCRSLSVCLFVSLYLFGRTSLPQTLVCFFPLPSFSSSLCMSFIAYLNLSICLYVSLYVSCLSLDPCTCLSLCFSLALSDTLTVNHPKTLSNAG